MMPRTPPSALEKAMRILSARGCSVAELTAKLRRAGYTADDTRQAVEECVRRRYLNDELLAEDCTAMWRERGHGSRSIRYKLRQRGLSAALTENAIAATSEQEEASAVGAIESRLYSLLREPDIRRRRAKALRFLAARGFSGEAVSAAMRRLREAEKADSDCPSDGC